jgi:hypothetical protein
MEEDPSQGELQLTPFEQAQRQLAEEERRSRGLAEDQLRAYARLVADFASFFLAGELDRRLRADPCFTLCATPATWRALLDSVRAGDGSVWQQDQAAPAVQDEAAVRWRQEAERLAVENRLLRDLLQGQASAPASAHAASPAPAPATPPNTDAPQHIIQLAAPGAAPLIPAMPAQPPERFASRFTNWPRASKILAALGKTGWAMRQAIAELVAEQEGQIKANAGSVRRAFENIAREGFTAEEKIILSGAHKPETPEVAKTTVILTRLTDDGRTVLRMCGIEPVASEWDVLIRRHDGANQPAHTALVCVAAYHARLRGCATDVCPQGAGDAQPDLAVTTEGQTVHVEVEAESGDAERRLTKWRNQMTLQGRAVLVAVTPEMRASLVAEAQAAGAAHGLATDLQTLFDTQEARGPLWAVEW